MSSSPRRVIEPALAQISRFFQRQHAAPEPQLETSEPQVWELEFKTERGETKVENLNGVSWFDAPVPEKKHDCTPQTRGWSGLLTSIERCACGGMCVNHGDWSEKNSRSTKQTG